MAPVWNMAEQGQEVDPVTNKTSADEFALSLTTDTMAAGHTTTLRAAIHDDRAFDAVRIIIFANSATCPELDGAPNEESSPRFRVDELRVDDQLLMGNNGPYRSFDRLTNGGLVSRGWLGLSAPARLGSNVVIEVTNRVRGPAAFSAMLLLRVAQIASEGCPSISTFQCNHCRRLFCSSCSRRSTCDSDDVGVMTIGHWYCDAPTCAKAGAVTFGMSVEATLAMHAGHPHLGRSIKGGQLDQLLLLGPTEEMRSEAHVALDESSPRWRALDALDNCARFLGIGAPVEAAE